MTVEGTGSLSLGRSIGSNGQLFQACTYMGPNVSVMTLYDRALCSS